MAEASDKADLRKHYRALRKAIPEGRRAQRSDEIQRLALSTDRLQWAGSVFVYLSSGNEVRTHELITALLSQDKTVAVPRVLAERGLMQVVVVRGLDDFAPGCFGIPEPTTKEVLEGTPDVTLVPGVAFTRSGLRLGQGGGYYDRYLAQHLGTYKIGLCFEEQLAQALPMDAHDVLMDEVLVG